jgi:hypothetical protein
MKRRNTVKKLGNIMDKEKEKFKRRINTMLV